MIEIIGTGIKEVVLIKPQVFADNRGSFSESFSAREFAEKVRPIDFVQENESRSRRGVVRGLHYQLPPMAQSKLVRVSCGKVLDVAVDIRSGSPTFGRYVAAELSDENGLQLFVPRGFAHGFIALTDEVVLQYKCDNYYSPQHEGSIAFDDPSLAIEWGMDAGDIILSEKDRQNPPLAQARLFDYKTELY